MRAEGLHGTAEAVPFVARWRWQMPIEGTCPKCGATVIFPDHAIGRKARCSSCEQVFRIADTDAGTRRGTGPTSGLARTVFMALALTVGICAVIAVPLVGLILKPGADAAPPADDMSGPQTPAVAVASAVPVDADEDGVLDVRDCRADFTGDMIVEAADLAILLGALGESKREHGDLTADGTVDAFDLAVLLGSWGPCAEPASLETRTDEQAEEVKPPQ